MQSFLRTCEEGAFTEFILDIFCLHLFFECYTLQIINTSALRYGETSCERYINCLMWFTLHSPHLRFQTEPALKTLFYKYIYVTTHIHKTKNTAETNYH